MRIAFVSNHPAPYRDPFLNRLVKSKNLEVDVYTLFPRDSGHAFWNLSRPEYADRLIVPRPCAKVKTFFYFLRQIVFGGYDFVLYPGFLLWYLSASMIVSALLKKPYGFTADTVEHDERMGWWQFLKRYVVWHADLIFCPGQAGKDYWMKRYGVPESKICMGAYALDNAALTERIAHERQAREALRKGFGLSQSEKVFLMVANMIPTRHYPITTSGFLKMVERHPEARFLIVGQGPDARAMQELAKVHKQLIVLPGVSFDEMLRLYALADVYVHGGTEPASTALVIGAIAGLPLISSMAVGCAWDCLMPEKSGFLVDDYLSVDDWQKGFEWMMQHEDRWVEMGVAANKLSEALSVPRTLESFENDMMNIGSRRQGGGK